MNNRPNPIRTAATRAATALLALAALGACSDDLDTGSNPYVHTPGQLGIAQITLADNPTATSRAAMTATPASAAAPSTRAKAEDSTTPNAAAGQLTLLPNTGIIALQEGDQLMAEYNFSNSIDTDTEAADDTYTALAALAADGKWTLKPVSRPGQPDESPVLRPNSATTTSGESWADARFTLSLTGKPANADQLLTNGTLVWQALAGMYTTAATEALLPELTSGTTPSAYSFFDALRANTSAKPDPNSPDYNPATHAETDADGAPLRGRVAIDRGTSSSTLGQISASLAHAGALMSLPRTAISGGSIIVGNSKLDITPQSVVGLYAVVSTNKLGNDATQPAGDVYVAFSPVGIGGQDHLQAIVPGNAEVKRFVAMISQPNPSAGGDPILTPLTIALTQTKTLKADYRYPMTLALKGSTATIALALPDKPGWGTADDETELADGMPYIEFVGGEGTEAAPLRYTTSHARGLRLLQQWINGDLGADGDCAPKTQILNSTIGSNRLYTHITLTRDIDFNDLEADPAKSNWAPIGNGGSYYRGTLDGGGHTLKNLRIVNSSREYQGLIAFLLAPGTVKNLTLEDVNISSTKQYIGAVAGYNNTGGKIENCHVTASAPSLSTVTGGESTGGITGSNVGGIVTQCTNAAAVEGSNDVGGIVGENGTGTVMVCSNTGSVKATDSYAGGIAGSSSAGMDTVTIVACSNTGSVSATSSQAGGIVGAHFGTSTTAYLYACWSTGSVTGSDKGGIVGGFTDGTLGGCFTTESPIVGYIDMSSVDDTNGIVTPNAWNGTATNSPTTGINILACLNGAIDKYNALSHVASDDALKCNHIYIANPTDATQPPVLKYLPDGYEIDGSGKWLIYNAKGLVAFRDQVNKGDATNRALKAQLMEDITMPATPWTECIAKDNNTYEGTFDGGGHTIYGLKVDMNVNNGSCYAGLFESISGGTVKNLTLSDVSISGSSNSGVYAGGIAGWTTNAGRIENCHVTGTSSSVTATGTAAKSIGGIVGLSNIGSVVMGCSNTGCNVTTQGTPKIVRVGGIVGGNQGSSVTACSNTGTVGATGGTDENYAGGIAGKSYLNSNSITACWSTGTATATSSSSKNNAGGIVGNTSDGATVTTCYTTQPIGSTGAGDLVSAPITATEWGALNTAIAGWNTANPAKKCPYRFDTATGAITK